MLKPDRHIDPYLTEISFVLNTVAEEGSFLSYQTPGSGTCQTDDNCGVCQVAVNGSGQKPLGVLLCNFVTLDQTHFHRNWMHNDQVVGEKAPIMRRGWVITNLITGTPTGGAPAYLADNGKVSPVQGSGYLQVGEFGGSLDADGYAKLIVRL